MVDIAGSPRLRFGECEFELEELDVTERKCDGGREAMVCGFNIGDVLSSGLEEVI